MPSSKSLHTKKWDDCVKKVKEKSPNVNPYAICSSSIKNAGLKKKHQKRKSKGYYSNRKKNENMITKFEDYNITEDATATLGNTGGMGNVVSANPSSVPGDVAGSSIGSGDIGTTLGTYTKTPLNLRKRKKKKKKKNLKTRENLSHEENKPYNQMYVVRFSDYKYTKNETSGSKVTYEMSGPPPKHLWRYKSDFINDMEDWGYKHTTLTKNTDMLIVESKDLDTLKTRKAKKYNIPIYTYEEAYNKKEKLYTKTIRKKHIGGIMKKLGEL